MTFQASVEIYRHQKDLTGARRMHENRSDGRSLEMIEGQLCGLAAAAGSFEEAGLNQIGLMDIFEGALVFLHCGSQGFHPDRSSCELVDDGQENLPIHLIKPRRIDAQPGERLLGNSLVIRPSALTCA